jgi:hypothetical protein
VHYVPEAQVLPLERVFCNILTPAKKCVNGNILHCEGQMKGFPGNPKRPQAANSSKYTTYNIFGFSALPLAIRIPN